MKRHSKRIGWSLVLGAAIASSTIAWGERGGTTSVVRLTASVAGNKGTKGSTMVKSFEKFRALVDRVANVQLRKQPSAPAMIATGVVLDENGEPAPGVLIDGSLLVGDLETPALSAMTDGDGRFALPVDLAYGGSVSGMLVASTKNLRGAVSLYLTRPGTSSDVEIKLKKSRTIRGIARLAGNPMGGVRLSAGLVGSIDETPSPPSTAVTDLQGRFELSVIGAGVYRLDALRSGVYGSVDYVQVLDDGPAPDILVELPEGREVVIRVVDDQGTPVAGAHVRTYAMAGDDGHIGTTDAQGRSLVMVDARANATLSIERKGYAPTSVQTREHEVEAVMRRVPQITGIVEAPMDAVTRVWIRSTDPNGYGGLTPVATLKSPGEFHADLMQEGNYEIVAYVEGVGESVRRPIVASVGSVTEVGTLSVTSAQGSIAGLVVDSTGNPVANVSVRVARSELGAGSFTATTDASGRFVLDAVPTGAYWAEADVMGRFVSQQVSVQPKQLAELTFSPDDSEGHEYEGEHEGEYDDEYEGEYEDEYDGEEYEVQYTPGVRWGWSEEGLVVLAPSYSDSEPAMPANLLPGDIIIAVNGKDLGDGEEGLYGKEGSTVRLKVRRPATNQVFETTVPRTAMEESEGGC